MIQMDNIFNFNREEQINTLMNSFNKVVANNKIKLDPQIPVTVYLENERCRLREVAALVQRVMNPERAWLPLSNKSQFAEFLNQFNDDEISDLF